MTTEISKSRIITWKKERSYDFAAVALVIQLFAAFSNYSKAYGRPNKSIIKNIQYLRVLQCPNNKNTKVHIKQLMVKTKVSATQGEHTKHRNRSAGGVSLQSAQLLARSLFIHLWFRTWLAAGSCSAVNILELNTHTQAHKQKSLFREHKALMHACCSNCSA